MDKHLDNSKRACAAVCAVVLAFQRPAMLRECIAALRAQTIPLRQIIVVDQGGSEEIRAWLATQPDLTVVHQANLGTAGGFGKGIELGVQAGHDWVWLFDDDGMAWPDALAELLGTPRASDADVGFLCSNTLTVSGDVQQASIPESAPNWYGTVLHDRCVRISRAAWLGLCVHRRAVEQCGLPSPEFFIWHDDQEFTERISRRFKGYCVLSSKITHKQSPAAMDPFTPGGWFKIKHGIRNQFGWERLRGTSLARRMCRMAKFSLICVVQILTRKLPLKAVSWLARGWFFSPRVPRLSTMPSCSEGTSRFRGDAA